MLRLARFTKPYLLLILLTIVLLFAQANFDLALPDYLSRIVNTGIQQSGIEHAAPEAIRQSQMERLTLFTSIEDKEAILNAYTLVAPADASPEQVKSYPGLAQEAVYIRQALSAEALDSLGAQMARPLLLVYGIQQALADPAAAGQFGGALGFDLSTLPAGADLFAMLRMLPAEQLAAMTSLVDEKFAGLGDDMLLQAAIPAVKAEYEALGVDTGKLQSDYIFRVGGGMLLLTLGVVICTIAVGFLSARTGAGMARDMRRAVFAKVESFASAEFDKFSTASLITRTTNDITQIQMVSIMLMRMVFYAPIMGVGGVLRVLARQSSMTWLVGVAVLVLIALIITVFSIALPKFKIIQQLVDRLNLVAREALSGMMVIRAFNMQTHEEERFDKANQDLTSVSLFINRLMVIMMPLMMLIMNVLSIAIIWFGAQHIANAQMQVGDMMAFMQYAMQIVMSFLMLSFMFIILPRAEVSADRIADVLEVTPAIHDPKEPRQFPAQFRGEVEFRGVSFRYPGAEADVLNNINFVARPGQTTAIIGSTGSGKSTVVNLIPRFHEVTGGAILLDGIDIRTVTQHDLRDKIGYIPQKSSLFSGTIESNLRYADKNASEEEMRAALEIAQAAEFVDANPAGLAAEIAQGGQNVSGGQKQRLSIARALVKKPPIYILDDSFSALDFKTDAALRRAFKEKAAGSTLIIVTQRVSTIMKADQIIVMEKGKIIGKGTHGELMKTCETYQEIASSQLSTEELA